MSDSESNDEQPDANIPRPTSEEDCARIVNTYLYLAASIVPANLAQAQLAYTTQRYNLINNQPSICGCPVINGRKCTGRNSCINRRNRVACPPSCGAECQNNPWAHNLWAIGRLTYLKYISRDKGYGIFAWKPLRPYIYVGEYRGVVREAGDRQLEQGAWSYLFGIEPVNQVIDPFRQGSACRLVNHSCDPNLVASLMCHDGLLKVVYMTRRAIKAHEELTINYSWEYHNPKFATKCLCGTDDCTGLIGTHVPRSDTALKNFRKEKCKTKKQESDLSDDLLELEFGVPATDDDLDEPIIDADLTLRQALEQPNTFPMVDANSSSEVQRFTSSQPVHPQRPSTYRETHIFQPHDNVVAIIPVGGVLKVTGGRIVACYQNMHGIYIYVVRSMAPGQIEYHLPRWLIFHYQEDAIFSRDSVFSEQDREQVLAFSTPEVSYLAEDLTFELVEDYVKKWNDDAIPKTLMVKSSQVGPVALGGPRHVLQIVDQSDDAENVDSSGDETGLKSTDRPPTMNLSQPPVPMYKSKNTDDSSNLPSVSSGPGPTSTSKQLVLASKKPSGPTPPVDSSTSGSSCGPSRVTPPQVRYDVNFRREFDEIEDQFQSNVMLRRMFENAVEQITLLALSRLPRNHISYEELYYIVRRDLEYHYFWAPPPQRRFLLSTHYRTATEVSAPGSMYLNWCSLCRRPQTFTDSKMQNRHYHQSHSIISHLYICPNCGYRTNFPTIYRDHLWTCDPSRAADFRTDIMPFVIDAYADYIAMRDGGNHPLYLMPPGLPLVRFKGTPRRPTHRRGEGSEGNRPIRMDAATMKPVDPTVEIVPISWNMQKSYKKVTGWDQMNYAENIDPQGHLLEPCLPKTLKKGQRRPPQAGNEDNDENEDDDDHEDDHDDNDDHDDHDDNDDHDQGPALRRNPSRKAKKRSRQRVREEDVELEDVTESSEPPIPQTSRKTTRTRKVHPTNYKSKPKNPRAKKECKKTNPTTKRTKKVVEQSSDSDSLFEPVDPDISDEDSDKPSRKRRH